MRSGRPCFLCLFTNYLVDVRAGVIVDVEASSAHRIQEVDATRTMIDRVEDRFAIKPTRLIGDMSYGAAEAIGWMVNEKAIEPMCRCGINPANRRLIVQQRFQWDEHRNEYHFRRDICAERLASIQERAYAHHYSQHYYL